MKVKRLLYAETILHINRLVAGLSRVAFSTSLVVLTIIKPVYAVEADALSLAKIAPLSSYNLEWLDKVDKLDETDVGRLQAQKPDPIELSQNGIDRTVSIVKLFANYKNDKDAFLKKEMLKLSLTALPSADVNQSEWRQRVALLDEAWVQHIAVMKEKDGEGFQMGFARMLCYGVGELNWKKYTKNEALDMLREYLHSDRHYTILGVLIGVKESNVRELNSDIVLLLKGDDDKLRQTASSVLAKVGNAETAVEMKQALDEYIEQHKAIPLKKSSIKAIENAIEQLSRRN